MERDDGEVTSCHFLGTVNKKKIAIGSKEITGCYLLQARDNKKTRKTARTHGDTKKKRNMCRTAHTSSPLIVRSFPVIESLVKK